MGRESVFVSPSPQPMHKSQARGRHARQGHERLRLETGNRAGFYGIKVDEFDRVINPSSRTQDSRRDPE
jgi:hypothetical protein